MQTLFLIILGITMLFSDMVALGIFSLLVALLCDRACERVWCVILAIVLCVSSDWMLTAALCLLMAFATVTVRLSIDD